MTTAPASPQDVLETAARALGRIDRGGLRAITCLSVREIEAMALVLAAMGLPAIPPGAALPGDHPASLLEGTADV